MKIGGVWGSICGKDWGNVEADLVCRRNGFAGGAPYLVPGSSKVKPPILMSNIKCTGSEPDLDKCAFTSNGHTSSCQYTDTRAGVLCYKSSGKIFVSLYWLLAMHKVLFK